MEKSLPNVFDNEFPEFTSINFRAEFDYYWKTITGSAHQEQTTGRSACLLREVTFYHKILVASQVLSEQTNNDLVFLFDIDGTIGEIKEDTNNQINTIIRPSFPLIIRTLIDNLEPRAHIGILTTRPQESLEAELINPTYLTSVRAFIDPQYVLSSKDATKNEMQLTTNNPQQHIHSLKELLRGVVRDELIEPTIKNENDIYDWYDTKLSIIAGLMIDHPEQSFVVIDDISYIDAIKTTNRLVGINVASERQNLFLHSLNLFDSH
ncbi:MAG: hypothetical protein NVSMB46_02540 [Candidatus Saccharimonadales bacterium]